MDKHALRNILGFKNSIKVAKIFFGVYYPPRPVFNLTVFPATSIHLSIFKFSWMFGYVNSESGGSY